MKLISCFKRTDHNCVIYCNFSLTAMGRELCDESDTRDDSTDEEWVSIAGSNSYLESTREQKFCVWC